MKEFRVEIKVKNALLYNAIMNHYASVAEFSRDCGVAQSIIGGLLNFTTTPTTTSNTWKDSVIKICDFLYLDPNEMFPDSIICIDNIKNKNVIEISAENIMSALSFKDDIDSEIDKEILAKKVLAIVKDKLTPREQKVIIHRFGLGDDKDKTLQTIGDMFGVSKDRIRQIEAKALHKLRYPKNKDKTIEEYRKGYFISNK